MGELSPSTLIEEKHAGLHGSMGKLSPSSPIEEKLAGLHESVGRLSPSASIEKALVVLHRSISGLSVSTAIEERLTGLQGDIKKLHHLTPTEAIAQSLSGLKTDIQDAIRDDIQRLINSIKTLVPSSDICDTLKGIREDIFTLTPSKPVVQIVQKLSKSMESLCPTDDIHRSLSAILTQMRHLTPSEEVKVGLSNMSQKLTDIESSIKSYHSAHNQNDKNSSISIAALANYMKEQIDGDTGITKSLLQLSQSNKFDAIVTELKELNQKVILLPQKDHIDGLISFAGRLIAKKLDQLHHDSCHHHTDIKDNLDTCMNTTMLKASACFDTLGQINAVLRTTISQSLKSALDNRPPSCLKEEDIVAIIVEKLPVLIQDAFELLQTKNDAIPENHQDKSPAFEDIANQLKLVLSSELEQINSIVSQHLSKENMFEELLSRLMSFDDIRVVFNEYEVTKVQGQASSGLVDNLSNSQAKTSGPIVSRSKVLSSKISDQVENDPRASPSKTSSQVHGSDQASPSDMPSLGENSSQTSQFEISNRINTGAQGSLPTSSNPVYKDLQDPHSESSNGFNRGVKRSYPSISDPDTAHQSKLGRLDSDDQKSIINPEIPPEKFSWSLHDIGYASSASSRKAPDKKLKSSALS